MRDAPRSARAERAPAPRQVGYEYLVFASDQPGAVTVGGATVALEGSASAGVYKARLEGGAAGIDEGGKVIFMPTCLFCMESHPWDIHEGRVEVASPPAATGGDDGLGHGARVGGVPGPEHGGRAAALRRLRLALFV